MAENLDLKIAEIYYLRLSTENQDYIKMMMIELYRNPERLPVTALKALYETGNTTTYKNQ